MGTRAKAKSDLKVQQGRRRDAYFTALKRGAQPKATAQSEAAAAAAKPTTTSAS